MLLDETFEIVWHTTSVTSILGWNDVVGRNGMEFIHPDDGALVIYLLSQIAARHEMAFDTSVFQPQPADVRIAMASGAWTSVEATAFDHTDDPDVRGVLVSCRLIVDRSDVARSIELLGSGAAVGDVLPLIARLAERVIGSPARCALAWWDDDDVMVVRSPDAPMPDLRLGEAAGQILRAGVVSAVTITDLSDPRLHGAGEVAAALGYVAANIVPIVAPEGGEVIGCLLGWGHHPLHLGAHAQLPLHLGLRIASLAIMEGRRKHDLHWSASHDPLTLLVNRAEFARALDRMSGGDVALLYLDLDDFKPINDLHGHSIGDTVLVEVAARIREAVGGLGVAGRLGGDEFAIACPGLSDVTVGWELADRVIAAIRRPIRLGNITVAVGASVGVAMGVHPLIPSILIQRADEALLLAKDAGKNTVEIAR